MFMNMSGVPVRVVQGGKNAGYVNVPAPQAGDEDSVLTVQGDLTVAWEPAAAAGVTLTTATVTVPNATLKSTTAYTLVAAQGAGTVIIPVQTTLVMRYGGTNVFTSVNPNFQFRYNGVASTGTSNIGPGSGFWQQAFDTIFLYDSFLQGLGNLTQLDNQPLTIQCSVAAQGNAANNNVLDVITTYYVLNV